MKACIKLAFTAMAFLVLVAAAPTQALAQTPPADVNKVKDELQSKQKILANQFAEFETSLLKLKNSLKRSGKAEDKLRADILEKVLEQAKDSSISVKFEQMLNLLQNNKLTSLGDLKILDEQSHVLADELRKLLELMREDPRYSRLRDERLRLEELIKRIEKVIHEQKVVQGQTDRNKTDPKELKKNQNQVTKATGDIAKDMDKGKEGGEPKDGKGGKGGGKGGQGQGQGGDGDPKKGGNPPPPPPAQPKDSVADGKKRVQDAQYKMKQAEDKIAKKDNKEASDDQGKAIQDLEKAKKRLEDLLRQIREEELERLLAALQARCEKMLAMQINVLSGTEGVFKFVQLQIDKKPSRQNQQDSLKLSDNEKDIVTEATKAIEMLEAEGSAVAFPEVFQQVRQDMMQVQRRLEVTDVGVVTQGVEKDIIDTLKEMIEALKKARQELENKKSPPPGTPPPPQDQKLLDLLAELKMIRSMQMRVNSRTETYAREYVPREGEQTTDPTIRRELSNLAERQDRIFEITNKLSKGDNK